ncbi:MAG: N-acetylmuramoyl-L-alanine amidase [Acidobacteria bacterium]|nr:N-acetylmuramoyl-L-alanine amidase [Acidobacteriota bacterium]
MSSRISRVASYPAVACIAAAVVLSLVATASSQTPGAFVLYTPEARHQLTVRTLGGAEFVSLEQLASIFKLRITEDTLVGGLTVQGSGQTILLIPGQSFASIGPGKVVALPAALQRDRNTWLVPIDFLRLALGPALGQRVEIRRPARTVLFGDVRLPQITARIDRVPPNARVTLELQSPAPHRVTREGNRLLVRFDAVDVDLAPVQGEADEFAPAVHADGTTVVVDLGPSAANYRADDSDPARVTIDLLAPGAPPAAPPPVPVARAAAPDPGTTGRSTGLDTIVLDPGHGGDDDGVRGPGGTKEKDYVLQFARRLKAAIETRIGLRVVLTRDADEAVPLDRRAAIANNDKTDLLISLHLNASVRQETRGAQVLALNAAEYANRTGTSEVSEPPVPVIGGGTRAIDLVPWDLAQLPFVDRSVAVAATLARQLKAHQVPLLSDDPAYLPLRPLVSANMPAVMLEMGFLSNGDEEAALNRADRPGAIVEAVIATVEELRRSAPLPPPLPGARP